MNGEDPLNFDELVDSKPGVPWSQQEGIDLAQQVQKITEPLGYYVGITGSVLIRGRSDDDLDLILYPGKTCRCSASPTEIVDQLTRLGLQVTQLRTPYHEGDTKMVFSGTLKDGHRVDLFFLR